MFIPTREIFCETTCVQMMNNDFPLCEFILVETMYTGSKHCLNRWQVHEPRPRGVAEVERQVLYDEEVVCRSPT
jgi:hypothetical protein